MMFTSRPQGKSVGSFSRTPAKRVIEVLAGNLSPVGVEIVDLERQHLVLLPLRHVDVLQHERRTAETQAGETAVAPLRRKAELAEERQRLLEIGPRRHEGDESAGL